MSESVFYCPDDTKPGDSLRYSDLQATGSPYQSHACLVIARDAALEGRDVEAEDCIKQARGE